MVGEDRVIMSGQELRRVHVMRQACLSADRCWTSNGRRRRRERYWG
jgi:hypothetical protein